MCNRICGLLDTIIYPTSVACTLPCRPAWQDGTWSGVCHLYQAIGVSALQRCFKVTITLEAEPCAARAAEAAAPIGR